MYSQERTVSLPVGRVMAIGVEMVLLLLVEWIPMAELNGMGLSSCWGLVIGVPMQH